jgi:hypothetical protein
MKKILGLIVLLAVIWAVPALRERLAAASVPVLERLGPVGAVVSNPARNYAARNRVEHYTRLLAADRNLGRPLPEPTEFTAWVKRRMPDASGLDPWGNPYWLRRSVTTVTVGSDGADGTRDSDDDITSTVTL